LIHSFCSFGHPSDRSDASAVASNIKKRCCHGGGAKEDDGGREKIGRSYQTNLKYQYKRMPHIFNTASRRRFGFLKTRTPTVWKISSFDGLTTQCISPIPANHPMQESSAVL
jgi:hypothetical protein